MYKLSYYTIITDSIDNKGNRILFSTRTSKVLLVPQITIDYMSQGRIDEIPETVVEKLIRISAIVPINDDELDDVVNENIKEIDNQENETLYEIIQPSAMCQLGCYYCGQEHSKNNISIEFMDLLVNRIKQKILIGNYKKLYIAWFGAEPLMAMDQIRELTKKIKGLAGEFGIAYEAKMVTNGLSLKEKVFEELVFQLGVGHFELTLDGTGHNLTRHTKKGGSSFKIIFENLKKIVNLNKEKKMDCKISIRCNVDKDNCSTVLPLIKLLYKNKIHSKISSFYAMGVYSWGNNAHFNALTKEEFARKEVIWIAEMVKLGFPINLIPRRRKQVCAATTRKSEMYDAFGNVFNCTEVSYVPAYEKTRYVLGNLDNTKSLSDAQRPFSDWNESLLTNKFPCHSCKLLPVCGGACPKSWHEDMRACPSAKFNIEERLKLAFLIGKSSSTEEFAIKVNNFEEGILCDDSID